MCKQLVTPLRLFIRCRMFFIAAMLLHAHTTIKAQSPGAVFLQGEQLFKDKKYFEAAQCYERYLAAEKKSKPRPIPLAPEKKVKGKTNVSIHEEAVYHLAESYRWYNNYAKAEPWYKEATKFSIKAYPESRYWYAVTLRANQKFAEATGVIDTFLQTYTTMGPVLLGADREFENLKFITAQLSNPDTARFTIGRAVQQKGSTSSYALTIKHEDTVVYTAIHADSTRQKNGAMQYTYTNELYESAEDENMEEKARMISLPKEGQHNGLASFSKDGSKMFFTQWIKQPGGNISAIYMRKITDTGWTKAIKMDDRINAKGYNSAQPFITSDGRFLLFASDMPGGIGKYDLWYAALDSNFHVLSAGNMGGIINTTADEQSPFYHTSSRTLVFASNGRIGMGGFDIYASKGNPGFTQWEKPVNAGMPINSVKDDLYYTGTDEENLWNTGWVSSDRSSDCCLALFPVTQNNSQYVKGYMVDCKNNKPLAGVVLTVTDKRHKGRVLSTDKTDSSGMYTFELNNASGIKILAGKQGYVSKDSSFTIHIKNMRDTVNIGYTCLEAVADTVIKAVNNILATLSQSATIGNFLYQKTNLDALAHNNLDSLASVMRKYPDVKIQIGGYTDGNGTEAYNLKLAQARVDVCVAYLVKKGIDKNRLVGKAFGECCPIEPDTIDGKDNPAGREKNRRVEYVMLQ